MAEDEKVRCYLTSAYFELTIGGYSSHFTLGTNGLDRSSPVRPDRESSVQPRLSLRGYAEELEGELIIPQDPRLSGGYADIYRGQWRRSENVEVEVAIKVFKQVWPTSISIDIARIKERVEKVSVSRRPSIVRTLFQFRLKHSA